MQIATKFEGKRASSLKLSSSLLKLPVTKQRPPQHHKLNHFLHAAFSSPDCFTAFSKPLHTNNFFFFCVVLNSGRSNDLKTCRDFNFKTLLLLQDSEREIIAAGVQYRQAFSFFSHRNTQRDSPPCYLEFK